MLQDTRDKAKARADANARTARSEDRMQVLRGMAKVAKCTEPSDGVSDDESRWTGTASPRGNTAEPATNTQRGQIIYVRKVYYCLSRNLSELVAKDPDFLSCIVEWDVNGIAKAPSKKYFTKL